MLTMQGVVFVSLPKAFMCPWEDVPQHQPSVRVPAVLALTEERPVGKEVAWPELGRGTVLAGRLGQDWGRNAATALRKLGLGLGEKTKGQTVLS